MSRNDARSTRLRRRPSRSIPALIVAVLLLAGAVALAWAGIARLVDGTWSTLLKGPRDWLTGLAWDSPALWGIGAGAVAVGIILLLCALIPGRFGALTVREVDVDGPNVPARYERETVMTRRSVAHIARARCDQIDGVGTATATATNKHVHLSVKTSLRETDALRDRVREAVHDRLGEIGLDPAPRVTATVKAND